MTDVPAMKKSIDVIHWYNTTATALLGIPALNCFKFVSISLFHATLLKWKKDEVHGKVHQ